MRDIGAKTQAHFNPYGPRIKTGRSVPFKFQTLLKPKNRKQLENR